MTFQYQYNDGKWSTEYIYSTHEALLGLTGVYNFGADERMKSPSSYSSRLSLGGEIFYAVLSKTPGISTCLRYTAQSAYTGTPLTMSLLCNPLIGHISAMYSLATPGSSFGSRFDFNVYSYESDLSIGCELWRKTKICDQNSGSDTIKDIDMRREFDRVEGKYVINTDDSFFSKKYKSLINSIDQTLHDTKQRALPNDSTTRKTDEFDIKSFDSSIEDNSVTESVSQLTNSTELKNNEKDINFDSEMSLSKTTKETEDFISKTKSEPIFSSFKGSTSLNNQTINMLWEGRYKELLISAGFGLTFMPKTPSITTMGVSVQYSS